MIGGIYTDEKCPMCGRVFIDNRKDGLHCPNHPEIFARKMSVRFKQTHKRFVDYDEAGQFLFHLRYAVKGYDPRDYQKSRPFGVANLTVEYLKTKHHLKSFRDVKNNINRAGEFFRSTSIKDVWDADLDDFINSLTVHTSGEALSSKSKHNILSDVRTFFKWVWKKYRFDRNDFPEFPKITVIRKKRGTTSKENQWKILNHLHKTRPLRTYLGIRWLAGYTKIRPGDIPKIKEEDVDRERGIVTITNPKENRVKTVYLLEEDIEMVKSLPLAMPKMPFFRHDLSGHGVKHGRVFGRNYLRRQWGDACKELGVEGVSLYPGTKHTSVTGLNIMGYSPEDIKKNATGHLSSAFNVYLESDIERQKELSRASLSGVSSGKELVKDLDHAKQDK